MVFVGIDVAKETHECRILNEYDEDLCKVFSFKNTAKGFNELYEKILSVEPDISQVKVGLEATGHYSCSILNFLHNKGFCTTVVNPLQIKRYGKFLSLRNTKTDKVDTRFIAGVLTSGADLTPYSPLSYHIQQLKEYTRYRFARVKIRSKYKTNLSRLTDILFPELSAYFNNNLHCSSVYALLAEFPSAYNVASANLTRLHNLLRSASRGRYNKEFALKLRDAARTSVGIFSPAKCLELQMTIAHIQALDSEVNVIESAISSIMQKIDSPILSIPGIGQHTAASIIAEIGDFSLFENPDKLLAFSGFVPSTYQSGKFVSSRCSLEKHGSKYLRCALYLAARVASVQIPEFAQYVAKKRREGKHYTVIMSAIVKKLVRLMFALEKSKRTYVKNFKAA